jgi:hypothetical protein
MVASCWLFLYDLYYDARNHEHQLNVLTYLREHSLLVKAVQFSVPDGVIALKGKLGIGNGNFTKYRWI